MKNKFAIKLIAASTTTLLHTSAFAEVDLSQGSFIYSDKSTSLAMIYNSRSLHRGLLGAGWCTPFEDSLDILNATTLRLRKCRVGKIVTYKLTPNTLRAPSSSTKSFVRTYESGKEKIVSSNSKFHLINEGQTIQTFDQQGKLLEVKDERGKVANLIYDKNGFLKDVRSGRTESLKLKVDPRSGRLVELVDAMGDHQGARTRLTFLKGNLISLAGPRKALYFNYDSVGNLTEVSDVKKTTSITYDSRDQVASVRISPDCNETYTYTQSEVKNQTEVITNCRGINNKRLVDFFYSKGSSGEKFLEQVSIRSSRLPATQLMGSQ